MYELSRMNKRIEIQKVVEARNSYNELDYGYETIAYRWAEVTSPKAGEVFAANMDQPKAKFIVRVRLDTITSTLVDNSHRILFKDKILRIDGITNEKEKNEFLILDCSEYKADKHD